MRLFFLRHGIADDRSATGMDADRELTPQGLQQMEAIAGTMTRLDLGIDLIVTSPLCRALQTAQTVAHTLLLHDRIVVDERGGPGLRLDLLREIVNDNPEAKRIMVVGHNPDIPITVGELVGAASIDFKKGALARVDTDRIAPGCGTLRWLVTPDILLC